MSLNCVSPYAIDTSSPPGLNKGGSLLDSDRGPYTAVDHQESLLKRNDADRKQQHRHSSRKNTNNNNNSSQESSSSPFHPMQLNPPPRNSNDDDDDNDDQEMTTTPSPTNKNTSKRSLAQRSPFAPNSNRYNYSQVEGLAESFQDESCTTPTSDRSSTMYISPAQSTSTSRSSHRAPTPTVNNTTSSSTRGFSFTIISPPTDQSSSLMTTTPSNNNLDQSSLINTMNLVSDSSDDDDDDDDSSTDSNNQSGGGGLLAALRPSPRDPRQKTTRATTHSQSHRQGKQRRRSPPLRQQFPYEKADTAKRSKSKNKNKSNNKDDGDIPNYYHPAYWNQRLARKEVYSRRYRPNPQEKQELNELEEFLGIPEARKSRRTILVQQWRLLNPSTSQASNQNIPMSIVLKRGPVSWGSHEECELILLTRGFAIARKVFQYIPRFQLGEVWTNVDKVLSTGLTSFTIECHDKTLDFICPTVSEQQAWMNALRIVVLQSYTHRASLLDTDDDSGNGAGGIQFHEGWQYKIVQTPWFTEAVTGQVRLDSGMLDQMDNSTLNELDTYNQCAPLHYATRANNVDAMRFLLQAGADPNLPDGIGRTPMQYAEEEKLPKSSIDLLRSYGGKGTNSNNGCLHFTPVKNTSRRCRLVIMAIVLLLVVATGVTTFLIWFLGKEDSNATNGISSQQSSSTTTTQQQDDESREVNTNNDDGGDESGTSSSSSSPPPFVVVSVNTIPATNMTITDSPYPTTYIDTTAPTSLPPTTASASGTDDLLAPTSTVGLVDVEPDESAVGIDSLTEWILNQTNAALTQALPEATSSPSTDNVNDVETLVPTQSQPSPSATPSAIPTSRPSLSPSLRRTSSPTYPTFEATYFLPLTSASPTFVVTHLATTAAPNQAPTEEFLPWTTESPTFVAANPTVAPTVTASWSPSVSPTVTASSNPSGSPTITASSSPSGSPTVTASSSPSGSPTTTASSAPSASPTVTASSHPSITPTATDAPTWSPTFAPTHKPTWSPTAAPTANPTGSPTTNSPSVGPTSFPTASPATSTPSSSPIYSVIIEEVATLVPSLAPAPTNFPTFASIHGLELLPEDISLFELLVTNSLDDGKALHNPKSPQYRAFRWLSGNMELTSYSDESKVQRYALATLYYSTGGEEWSNNQYWLSDEDECTMWFSRIAEVVSNAVCNSEGQIITLDLDYNNLRGRLPGEVGLLKHLRRMELYGGPQWFLTGTMPTEVGLLRELESLSVRGNRMTGAIPSALGNCEVLDNLNLSQNRFSGTIPSYLGTVRGLEAIALETNRLTGSLPSQLGQVGSLRSITVGTNSLTGMIFTEIGLLRGLRGLDLEMNQLSSTIPSEMGLLANLTLFHVTDSGLYGTLPWELGNMKSLESLQLRGNILEGTIPSTIGQLTNLGALDMSFNNLSGQIPPLLGQATLLRSLLLNSNKLRGSIPTEMAALSRLNTIRLELNNLTGTVPMDVCDVFFNTYPIFYADCFEVACPCCSYCCVDDEGCDCVYAGTLDEFLC